MFEIEPAGKLLDFLGVAMRIARGDPRRVEDAIVHAAFASDVERCGFPILASAHSSNFAGSYNAALEAFEFGTATKTSKLRQCAFASEPIFCFEILAGLLAAEILNGGHSCSLNEKNS